MFFIVLIILVLLGVRGFKRGILGIIYGIVAWIFIIVFVQWASPQAYNNLKQDEKIVESISSGVENVLNNKADEITVENAEDELSEEKVNSLAPYLSDDTLEKYNQLMANLEDFKAVSSQVTDSSMKQELDNQANEALDAQKAIIVEEATDVVTDYILQALGTVIAVVIGCIICSLVWMFVGLINRAPIIGPASHFLGAIFGIFEGLLIVWIIMYVVSMTLLTDTGAKAFQQISENEFLLYLYNNNILMDYLK